MSMALRAIIKSAALMTALVSVAASAPALAGPKEDEEAIKAVLSTYQDALNASSTDAVMPLYMDDGVFMPPHSQSAVGKDALKTAYDTVFKTITLHVKFTVAEVVEMSPTWAFARTNSAGTNTIHATGKVSPEGNQELFIFKKDKDGKWKIARYSFSPTNPLQAGETPG
jgi:uncharacterized protein (TIGR02246 family)